MATDSIATKGLAFGRHIKNVGRMAQIVNILTRHGFWTFFDNAGLRSWLTPEQVRENQELDKGESAAPKSIPRRLREALEELGPAFVKLGQMLASREDLMPKSFINELAHLHKNVTTIPFHEIKQVLETELGAQKLEQFETIVETPLAAGSIGQVHKAILKSGDHVVIKVQRPNIAEQIKTDLSLMEVLAGTIEKYVPEAKFFQPRNTVIEFKRAMLSELDFIREAGNTNKVADNFHDNLSIEIPRVYWDCTTSRVLTLSFIEGFSLADLENLKAADLNTAELIESGFSAFLQMVFVDGLYHGDLHAGNLLAMENNRVGMLDFGLTVRLSQTTKENLAGLLVSLIDENYEGLVSHFLELANPGPGFELNDFEEDVGNLLSPFIGLHYNRVPTGRLLFDLARVAAEHNAPMPRQLILFFRTVASFEGVGAKLDPNFDIIEICRKFSADLVKRMYSKDHLRKQSLQIARDLANLARHAPRQFRSLLKQIADGDLEIKIASRDLRAAINSTDRVFSRLAVSVILGSLIIGSSILVLAKVGREYYHMSFFGLIGFAIAGILGLYIVWSILRGGRF